MMVQWLVCFTRDSKGHQFDSRPLRFQATTSGKLFAHTWASTHRGKWGQLTLPGKMDEKLISENVKERAIGAGRCRQRRYADHIFIQIYYRLHHFAVKFSKILPQAARGH